LTVMKRKETKLTIFDTGPIDTLKQGKKSAVEVKKGAECGVSFGDWEDFMQGDQIQVIEEVVTKRRLQ